MNPITEIELRGLFAIAGIHILKTWQLVHAYVPYQPGEEEAYTQRNALYRASRPSWLVKTPYGLIELELRKRVVEINWSDTGYDALDVGAGHPVTKEDVTKGHHYVHAWDLLKAAEYLTALARELKARDAAKVPVSWSSYQPPVVNYHTEDGT